MSDPIPAFTRRKGPLLLSDDSKNLDIDVIHEYLARSYWAAGIPRDIVARSIAGSLCFGLFDGGRQVGFARCVTDRATFAYLADVFILESHRGRGLASWMMEGILAHPDLRSLRRFSLVTRDAQGLYRKFGFTPLANPERSMEIVRKGIYEPPI